MNISERISIISKNKEESSNNISFSSNNSFYEKLDIETKRDIIFLIKSGYDKKAIIKLYILIKPSNINEAVNYLTKENGINQHLFYNLLNDNDSCEICGDKKDMHINNINSSISFTFNNIRLNVNSNQENKKNIINIKNKNEIENKCKICEEVISEEEIIKNKCEQCENYFCSECLYMHIRELIRNGKYSLFCPGCSFVYTKDKIDEILSFNIRDQEEINNLKKLLEKSNTKEIILSNPELMFCPIVNCDGFAKKNNNKEYNICTFGHKFCIKCGELCHENGKCKEEENIDKLFDEYRKLYELKNCPYCNIVTNKNGGCNHIKCEYCGKDWCWLCQEIFASTEEHYGNRNSRCFGRMQPNIDIDIDRIICSKCENQLVANNNFRTFSCDHRICDNCFKENLLENKAMILFPVKLLNCIILGCKGYKLIYSKNFIDFIKNTRNEKLIKKYNPSILFLDYGLQPFFPDEYGKYLSLYNYFLDWFEALFIHWDLGNVLKCVLEVLFFILAFIFFLIFIILVPIFFHFAIKDLYYFKFLPEIRKKYYNKIIYFTVILGEEILSLIFLFPLIAWHYIYPVLFLPIMFLVILIRNLIYGVKMC